MDSIYIYIVVALTRVFTHKVFYSVKTCYLHTHVCFLCLSSLSTCSLLSSSAGVGMLGMSTSGDIFVVTSCPRHVTSMSLLHFLPHFKFIQCFCFGKILIGFPGRWIHRVTFPLYKILHYLFLSFVPQTLVQNPLNDVPFLSINQNQWWRNFLSWTESFRSFLILSKLESVKNWVYLHVIW